MSAQHNRQPSADRLHPPKGRMCAACGLHSMEFRTCSCCGDQWLICAVCEGFGVRLGSAS